MEREFKVCFMGDILDILNGTSHGINKIVNTLTLCLGYAPVQSYCHTFCTFVEGNIKALKAVNMEIFIISYKSCYVDVSITFEEMAVWCFSKLINFGDRSRWNECQMLVKCVNWARTYEINYQPHKQNDCTQWDKWDVLRKWFNSSTLCIASRRLKAAMINKSNDMWNRL